VRSGTTWSQQAYVKASNPESGDDFGSSVALSADGNTLVVGARLEDSAAKGVGVNQADNSLSVNGAAYVFKRSGATWTQTAYVKIRNAGLVINSFNFADAVAVSGDGNTIAIGAQFEDGNATGINGTSTNTNVSSGAVYLY
jgi:hypothetical protein